MYLEMLYGEIGQILLEAFTEAGGTIEVTDLWDFGFDAWMSDLDYVNGEQVIQLDEDLTPVNAARHLMQRLIDASGYVPVRNQIAEILNQDLDNDAVYEALILSYQSSAQTAAGTAALLAELYVSGITIINEPLDLVISIGEIPEGNYVTAAMGIIPFVPASFVKQGGKVIIKSATGVVKTFDGPMLETLQLAKRYADLVNSNQWSNSNGWSQLGNPPDAAQRKARQFARDEGLIPNIPVAAKTRYADFSSVAYEIPGATHPGNMVQLPRDKWKLGDTAQAQYLNDLYLNGVQPDGYVWHHHEKDGLMQLVPQGIHTAIQHNGGRSLGHWGYPRTP